MYTKQYHAFQLAHRSNQLRLCEATPARWQRLALVLNALNNADRLVVETTFLRRAPTLLLHLLHFFTLFC